MKYLNLYLFFTLLSTVHPSLMPTKKLCKDCRHFIGGNKLQCRKIGDTDIITGEVTYKSARYVRDDEKLCGENAIYFEENKFKIITIPYYIMMDDLTIQIILLILSYLSLYL
jgi:hypothetical protein